MANLVFNTANDEKVKVDNNIVSVGETVLIHKSGEEFVLNGSSQVVPGDEVLVFQNPDNKEFYCVKSSVVDTCMKITDGFMRNVNYQGEIVNIGTFTFNWDGTGNVYLLESCNSGVVNASYADDKLKATTDKGNVYYQYGLSSGGVPPGPPLEITSILDTGENRVKIEVIDVYGYSISCISLYIVQIT